MRGAGAKGMKKMGKPCNCNIISKKPSKMYLKIYKIKVIIKAIMDQV